MRPTHYNRYLFDQFLMGNRYVLGYYYTLYVDRIFDYSLELTGDRHTATVQTETIFVMAFVQRETMNNEDELRVFLFMTAKRLAEVYLRDTGRMIEWRSAAKAPAAELLIIPAETY